MTRKVTIQMVILINKRVIDEHSPDELIGIKEHHLLDSALNRPYQSAFGNEAYPTIHEKAAALLESLAQNHCFHNANKRTALLATSLFYRLNGLQLRFDDQKFEEDFIVDVVLRKYSFQGIVEVLEQHST
ncbi:type II toxin-antitoxin system death-on-curing family toxin [Chryseomicrobium imtechense]